MDKIIVAVSAIVTALATVFIARATWSYAKIACRTLNGMKTYLKLMVKQASIMQNQYINTLTTDDKQRKEAYNQAQNINAEILQEIKNI